MLPVLRRSLHFKFNSSKNFRRNDLSSTSQKAFLSIRSSSSSSENGSNGINLTSDDGRKSRRVPVRIMEVSPRDGLQNEPKILSVELKLELIKRLFESNLNSIEIGSFVSPKWVPQMGSTSDIVSHRILKDFRKLSNGATFSCLIPNSRGFESLESVQKGEDPENRPVVNEIAIFASATEGFSKANLNCSIAESLEKMSKVIEPAKSKGLKVRGYVSCFFGCPFEGKVDPNRAVSVTKELIEMGCYEVAISDTIGVGVPSQVEDCINILSRSKVSLDRLGIHCHDTFGTALANALRAVELGIRTVDSSVGGIGGCPYSPGATGNVATEDVVFALESSGYSTGILSSSDKIDPYHDHVLLFSELKNLVEVGDWINSKLGRVNSSRVGNAIKARQSKSKI